MAKLTRTSNTEFLQLPDCEGLREDGKCSWLNVKACTGIGCTYFRQRGGKEKTYQRLRSLSEEEQLKISQKYYNGAKPWLEGNTKTRR